MPDWFAVTAVIGSSLVLGSFVAWATYRRLQPAFDHALALRMDRDLDIGYRPTMTDDEVERAHDTAAWLQGEAVG